MKTLKYLVGSGLIASSVILAMNGMNESNPSCEIAPEYFLEIQDELVLVTEEQLELETALALSLLTKDQIQGAQKCTAAFQELELALRLSREQAEKSR